MPQPPSIALSHVVVPVTNQERALVFYRDVLGFQVRTDAVAGDGARWLEVAAADGQTSLALVVPRGGMFGEPGGDTRVCLATPDIEALHEMLKSKAVDVDPDVVTIGGGVPPFFFMRDPDANTLQVIGAP